MNKKSNDGNQVGNGLPRDSVRTGDISGWEKRLAAGEHLRTLLKKAPSSGTWTLDIATRQLTVTAAVLRLHNLYPRRETPLSFETFLQSIHPLDRQNVEDAVKAAFTGTTLLVVYRCLDSEGTIRWLEAHGGIYHTSTGDLLKAWVQDITEQKVRELHGDFMEDVTDRIHYIEDPSDILEAAAAAVGSHLGLSHCFFTKIDDRGKLAFVTGDYHPRTPSIAGLIEVGLPGGVCRADLDEGQVVVCEDGEKDVRLLSLECRGWYLDHGFRALVVVPVFEQRQRVALFWAVSDRPRKWNDQEIALVQKAAKRSWSVSEKARMQKHSRKIESELDQQSRLLEAFSAAVQDCLYVFDTEGRIVYANRILLDLWGLTREQAIGKTVRELGYPQDAADTLFHGIQQVIASSNVVRNETSYPGPAGVSSQYENVLSPMFGEDGRVVFIAGASRNVTEHLRAEEALRRSRQRFELLSKVAGELLQTQEPQDKIKQLCGDVMAYLDCQVFLNFLADENKKVLRLHAWSGINEETAKVLDEMPLWDMICQCVAWDGVRIATERMAKPQDLCCDVALSLGLTACACHPLIAGDRVIGTLLFGTYTRTSFADDELSLMKMVAEHVAVSMEQMRLLEELRTARERLESRVAERTMELRDLIRKLIERERLLQEQKTLIKTVLEYLPVGVLVIDGKGRIIEANPAAEKIWDGIRYRSIDQCGEYRAWWTNTGKPLSSNELAGLRALATAEACLNQEIEIEAFDGTRKIILDSAVPILGKNGEPTAPG